MALVIKKKVVVTNDEFSASLVFSSIPFKDFGKMSEEVDALAEKDASNNTSESLNFIQKVLEARFIEGTLKQGDEEQKITKENLFDLPGDTVVDCFQQLLGKTSPNS